MPSTVVYARIDSISDLASARWYAGDSSSMETNTARSAELQTLLRTFNKGVQRVECIDACLVCVEVSNSKAAFAVKLDLLRSGGFRSVATMPNAKAGRGFLVHGFVK